jgi:thiol-disulfide isomerase/thioredoxin
MSWTASTLKFAKSFVAFLLVVLFIWFLYRFSMRIFFKKTEPAPLQATFLESDSVKVSSLSRGLVADVDSDKTADAILSGLFGPAVVQFYAPWCSHCKNMSESYEAAAKASEVPFVRVLGSSCPATVSKFGVAGYPTIFGVSGPGTPTRFGSARTTEAFADFAKLLLPQQVVPPIVPSAPVMPVQPPPNMASVVAALQAQEPVAVPAQLVQPVLQPTNVTVYNPVPEIISIEDTPAI